MRRAKDNLLSIARRVSFLFYLALVIFLLLVFRLYHLQGIKGSYYRDMSENNRRRAIRIAAPRGDIYDREGRVLVRNRPAFDVALMKEDVEDLEHILELVSEITGISKLELEANFKKNNRNQPFVPRVIVPDIDRELLSRVKANSYRLPGVIVRAVPARIYPHTKLASQVLGYVREISGYQLEADNLKKYRQGDLVGQSGIEKQFEEVLGGTAGYLQVEVDARGNRRDELSLIDTKKGKDLYLTIDLDLQEQAEKSLGEFSGAVVAIDPRSGEILALASSPQFDANIFSGAMRLDEWKAISSDPRRPLRNRAIANHYPPGSTVKLFLAAAGLSAGVIKPNTKLYCPGYYKFAGRRYHCHKRNGHGQVDLAKAIRVSCNAFYYQLGQMLGIDEMSRFGHMLGYGQKTGIALDGEVSGIMPSPTWKKETQGERWYPGDTLPVSIGQGYLVVTPIQHAFALAALVNGGTLYHPQIVKKVVSTQNDKEEKQYPAKIVRKLEIDPEILKVVMGYAEGVVQHKEGTGHKAAFEQIRVGGKTGTAQVRSLRFNQDEEKFRDHAWFIGFAPAEDPQIVVSVIVENGGHGGTTAAPVTRDVMEVFFKKKGFDTGPLEKKEPEKDV